MSETANQAAGASRAAKRRRKKKVDTTPATSEFIIKNDTPSNVSLEKLYEAMGGLDSPDAARKLLSWILAGVPVDSFFEDYWEKSALVITGNSPSRFKSLISREWIVDWVANSTDLAHGVDVDIVKYEDEARTNFTDEELTGEFLNSKLDDGCSARLLCPQKYSTSVAKFLSTLEENFSAMVGANVYLTPGNSQGFAPHWDDIDAFILQIEGKKLWRVYPPTEPYPRFSSKDFTEADLEAAPIFEVLLCPGDVLYMPKGFIHQAMAPVGEDHSLHLTLSTNQRNSIADMMEIVAPQALAFMFSSCVEARRGLPRDYMEFLGARNSELKKDPRRESLKGFWKDLWMGMADVGAEMLDAAADQMIKNYVMDKVPIPRAPQQPIKVVGSTRVYMRTRDAGMLVVEDEIAVVYHCVGDHKYNPVTGNAYRVEFELDDAPVIEELLRAYPDENAVTVDQLWAPDGADTSRRIAVTQTLVEEGVLLVRTRQ